MAQIQEELRADHTRLEALFGELVDTVEGADEPTIQQMWSRFESGLLAHFDAEERYILPLLEKDHAAEVQGIEEEHDRIRRLVAELGVRADLHTLRKDVVDELIATLRAHAEREDRTLYPLADAAADAETRLKALDFLRREAKRRLEGVSGRVVG
jgi:hemerythrin superfamily protein